MRPSIRAALTLIELLVVVAIIGILVALSLPAMQWAREATRRTQCQSHLKQMALGALIHHEQQGHLPTGGWDHAWTGDPDRGFGCSQPGGWAFNLLPFVDELQLHQLGAGESYVGKLLAIKKREATPVAVFFCPSRRSSVVIQEDPSRVAHHTSNNVPNSLWAQHGPIVEFAPMDYLANKSYSIAQPNKPRSQVGAFPDDWQQADSPDWVWPKRRYAGVVYSLSRIRIGQISRGSSKTLLFGEKFVSTYYYQTNWHEELGPGGNRRKFNGSAYLGDTVVHSNRKGSPQKDSAVSGVLDIAMTANIYGSAHPGDINVAMCDGSVRSISHDVSHRVLGGSRMTVF